MNLIIKKATTESIALISSLSHRIWPNVYAYMISKEQIDYMLEMMYSKESLLTQFNEGHHFYIAFAENIEVGFASWNVINEQEAKLQKLYVMAEFHGYGIGFQLLQYIEKEALRAGCIELHLNVNRHNKSIAFYERNGFIIKETVDISIGNGFFMNDYVMAKRLK